MTTYNLGAVKSHVADAAHEVGNKFGIPAGEIGGFGYRPQNPSSDHPKGLALDFMIDFKGSNNVALGDSIAQYGIANAARLGIRYIIWNTQEWWPGQGWKPTGSYSPHTDHNHWSFEPVPGNTNAPVNDQIDIPGPWNADKPAWFSSIETLVDFMSDKHNWSRIGIVIVGFLVLIVVVIRSM